MPISAWHTHFCKSGAREPFLTPVPPSNLCPMTPPVATTTSYTIEFIECAKLFHTPVRPLSKHSKGPIPICQWEYGGSEVYSYLCSWAEVRYTSGRRADGGNKGWNWASLWGSFTCQHFGRPALLLGKELQLLALKGPWRCLGG